MTMDILHREAFCLFTPISVDEIEKNLFLGSLAAAKDIDTLNKLKITHILTIDTCPLPRNILELKHLSTKYIQLSDLPKEDLLSNFDDTYNFIETGISEGAILVHCYFGLSRSATIVIAYVMKKHSLSYTQAFKQVKLKRKIIYPNSGFISQLKLYEEMGCKIDKSHMTYKVFKLNMAPDKVQEEQIIPQSLINLIQADTGFFQVFYRCTASKYYLASLFIVLVCYLFIFYSF